MSTPMTKEEAHRLVKQMPENATWDDLMHLIYVQETLEKGPADREAGRVREVADVRARYGLPKGRA